MINIHGYGVVLMYLSFFGSYWIFQGLVIIIIVKIVVSLHKLFLAHWFMAGPCVRKGYVVSHMVMVTDRCLSLSLDV